MKRDYIALWSILAVAFVIFLMLSTCDDISIGSMHLRSSGMADAITGNADQPSAPTSDSSAPETSADTDTASVVLSSDPKTVLIIGDSMLEGLTPRLAAYCSASGHKLYSVIWYSSTTEQFGKTKLLADYIAALHPDYIFLSLGGNELFVRDVEQKRGPYVKEIVREIGDIPYIWIGPPNWKDDTGINDLIKANVPDGCYFRSAGMEFERKKDGAHPTLASAALWTDSIVRWMPLHAKYIMSLEPYVESSMRPTRYYIHQPGELTERPKASNK